MRIGALGGPGTFAGQAAERFRGVGSLSYFPSGAEEWQALEAGDIDAFVMLAESSTTGPADLARRAAGPDFPFFVVAEARVPSGCLLLAKPGSGPIQKILGHGSISQCMAYLERHYPDAEVVVEQTSSLDAAEKVLQGDGSLALVGTAKAAELFGLAVAARDIDGGATGNYWLVGRRAELADYPTTLVLSGRFAGGSELGLAVIKVSAAGFSLRTIASWPTGRALFEYDYLLSFAGPGELGPVRRIQGSRLVGAF